MTETKAFRLPGLVDMHVHLRDPGETHKEDFLSGTSAALAGGYTNVFDMPNNLNPIVTETALEAKIESAKRQIVCDVGFYFGSQGDNLEQFDLVKPLVYGLKIYLNTTTGNYLLDTARLEKIFEAWNSPKPIMVHAEADVVGEVIKVVAKTGQATHICHVSSRSELEPIIEAKRAGLNVTCGVCPQHLFLNDEDAARLGAFGEVKPSLKPQADQDFLWENFDLIDVIESDHAPHTSEEKRSKTAPDGMPGLETTLSLLLQAEREGRLTRADIIAKCATVPSRILGLEADPTTYIDVDPIEFEVSAQNFKSKAGWTPFSGRKGYGIVSSVTLRGAEVYSHGKVLASPGSGRIPATSDIMIAGL